jgi:hypothetical protein
MLVVASLKSYKDDVHIAREGATDELSEKRLRFLVEIVQDQGEWRSTDTKTQDAVHHVDHVTLMRLPGFWTRHGTRVVDSSTDI